MDIPPRIARPAVWAAGLVLSGLVLSGLAGCASTAPQVAADTALCETQTVRIRAGFPTAGQHRCLALGGDRFIVRVDPEIAVDPPVNPSPWYAFDIDSASGGPVEVTLDYGGYWHRYAPRIRRPGGVWQSLDPAALDVFDEDHRARLTLDLPPGRTRIAAQPPRPPADIARWTRQFAQANGFGTVEYGRSREDRPLTAILAGPADSGRLVVALTRQHPPEVSGGRAFEVFAQTLAAALETGELADTRVVLVPLANPDGVANGYWRLNAGGVDLNRDWFEAGEPEVAAVQALIRREARGRTVTAFLDFHSTRRTLVYNPPAGVAERGDALMADMAVRFSAEMEIPPDWVEGHNPDTGTSKAWALQEFGIAGLTIELADEADAGESATVGRIAAEAVIAQSGARASTPDGS